MPFDESDLPSNLKQQKADKIYATPVFKTLDISHQRKMDHKSLRTN